jgi:hypothetical protein
MLVSNKPFNFFMPLTTLILTLWLFVSLCVDIDFFANFFFTPNNFCCTGFFNFSAFLAFVYKTSVFAPFLIVLTYPETFLSVAFFFTTIFLPLTCAKASFKVQPVFFLYSIAFLKFSLAFFVLDFALFFHFTN